MAEPTIMKNFLKTENLKIGRVYIFTSRVSGKEYHMYKGHRVTDNCWHEDIYTFEQLKGKHFCNGTTNECTNSVGFHYRELKTDQEVRVARELLEGKMREIIEKEKGRTT